MLTSIKYHPEVQVISLTGCVLVQRPDKPEVIPGKAPMMDDKHVCLKCRLHTMQLGNCCCLGWFSYAIMPSDVVVYCMWHVLIFPAFFNHLRILYGNVMA